MKPNNSRLKTRVRLLDLLSQPGPFTRATRTAAGLGPGVSNRAEPQLAASGVISVGDDGTWELGAKYGRMLAFSATRERLRGALVHPDGRLIGDTVRQAGISPRRGQRTSPTRYRDTATAMVTELLERYPSKAPLVGCVVAWPAAIEQATGEPKRFEGESRQKLRVRAAFAEAIERASRVSGVPVQVLNDADAEALGETHFGVARGKSVVLLVKLCGGVGAALVVDGRRHAGAFNESGELGHLAISEHDRFELTGSDCSCGAKDHLECFASGKAIIDACFPRDRTGSYNDLIAELEEGELSYDRANLLVNVGKVVGRALRPAAILLDPDAIVLASVPHRQELLDGLRSELFEGLSFNVNRVDLRLGTSPGDGGDLTMLRGAGHLASQTYVLPGLREDLLPERP